ncbi:hypothetical protein FNV43_RR19217 [Rhamnella rubrinervis]|uniref:Disease resistance protein winged helix domain-containing protein n=1 Tax=Rhamnella rubrinervis TaxID=2594499 RepID=A0A8K0E276_9ROSA|nr:hypothetical protein FNV43_RR19217 [Rhamnella rubrinervis]
MAGIVVPLGAENFIKLFANDADMLLTVKDQVCKLFQDDLGIMKIFPKDSEEAAESVVDEDTAQSLHRRRRNVEEVIHDTNTFATELTEGIQDLRDSYNNLANREVNDITKDYLEKLIDRKLIQVASKRNDGGVKWCRIHDHLQDLCIKVGAEEKFLEIHSNADPSESFKTSEYVLASLESLPSLRTLKIEGFHYVDDAGFNMVLTKITIVSSEMYFNHFRVLGQKIDEYGQGIKYEGDVEVVAILP